MNKKIRKIVKLSSGNFGDWEFDGEVISGMGAAYPDGIWTTKEIDIYRESMRKIKFAFNAQPLTKEEYSEIANLIPYSIWMKHDNYWMNL